MDAWLGWRQRRHKTENINNILGAIVPQYRNKCVASDCPARRVRNIGNNNPARDGVTVAIDLNFVVVATDRIDHKMTIADRATRQA